MTKKLNIIIYSILLLLMILNTVDKIIPYELLNAFVLVYTTYFLINGLNKSNKKTNEEIL